MFVKVYTYHVKKEKVEQYLAIQNKAVEVYMRYINCQTIHLQSHEDETKWMEITEYESEEVYNRNIVLVNENKEIQEFYKSFQEVLLENSEIYEEDFTKIAIKYGNPK